jgi:hypothetical protein
MGMQPFRYKVAAGAAMVAEIIPDEADLTQSMRFSVEFGTPISCEGPNFATVADQSTPGASRSIVLGPSSLTSGLRNGIIQNPDLQTVRQLTVSLEPVPQPIPNWIPGATTRLSFAAFGSIDAPGALQNQLIASVRALGTPTVLVAGNFAAGVGEGGATALNTATAAWAAEITAQRFLPALGTQELVANNILSLCATKFPYVTEFGGGSPRHYYDRTFGVDTNGVALAHVFMLSAGIEGFNVEPSISAAVLRRNLAQWNWMETRLAAVASRFRIAVIHNPPVSYADPSDQDNVQLLPEAVELARSGHFDLILCGNSKTTETFVVAGTRIINVSGCVGGSTSTPDVSGTTALLEQSERYPSAQCFVAIDVTKDALRWEFRERVSGSAVMGEWMPPQPPAPLGAVMVSVADFDDGDEPWYLARMPLIPGAAVSLVVPDGLSLEGDNAALLFDPIAGRPAPRGCQLRALVSGF